MLSIFPSLLFKLNNFKGLFRSSQTDYCLLYAYSHNFRLFGGLSRRNIVLLIFIGTNMCVGVRYFCCVFKSI